MRLTPRDQTLLERVRALRLTDSTTFADLFPSVRAMQQRLWVLQRSGYLRVIRHGRGRVYLLGYAGARALGLRQPVRMAPSTIRTARVYGAVRRLLEGEGYHVRGSRRVGRVEVLETTRGTLRVGAVALDRVLSRPALEGWLERLRPITNPFNSDVDGLLVFLPRPVDHMLAGLPPSYQRRIQLRQLPRLLVAREDGSGNVDQAQAHGRPVPHAESPASDAPKPKAPDPAGLRDRASPVAGAAK